MTLLAAAGIKYPARLQRAELLAAKYPFSTEILKFYLQIATFQRQFYEGLPKAWGKRPIVPASGLLRSELNIPVLFPAFGQFLSLIESTAPGPLAGQARMLKSQGESTWRTRLEEFWRSDLQENDTGNGPTVDRQIDPLREFLSRAFLQPYAEFIAGAMLPPVTPMTVCRCPRCNSLPLVGVLRPEGDGGKRFLQCSLCSQEWEFLRILCAKCGETREEQLPVSTAEQFPHIRVEACETCKHYLRTIDLTKDGNAVPIVDDLAVIPLSLWADQHGYQRIQSNLLGS